MLKIKLVLIAERQIGSYEIGDECVIFNNVFDKNNGIAFHSMNSGWRIKEMEILNYAKEEAK